MTVPRFLASIHGHQARVWLAGGLLGWTLLILAVAGYRAWSVTNATVCPTDEAVASFCRSAVFSSSLDSLRAPAVAYVLGLALLGLAWLGTMIGRLPEGA